MLWGHTLWHLQIERIPIIGDFIEFFIGVPVFFILSGFLIWQSINQSKSFGEYAKKRFWRIYPELWLAVVVEIVVLLLLYHEPIHYPQLGLFTFGQATIFQFWTPDFLRGYGCGCPNGALWTITILIQFYFCAYFIFKWLKGRQSWIWWVVVLISVIIGWVTPFLRLFLPDTVSKLCGVSLIPYLWMFMMAAFASEKKDKVIPFLKSRIVDRLVYKDTENMDTEVSLDQISFYRKQVRVALRNCGVINPEEICVALGCPDIIVCFVRHDNAFCWYSGFCLCGTSGKN